MECSFEINVKKPDSIDFQINELINNAEKLRKTAKKKLKNAKSSHDKILSER